MPPPLTPILVTGAPRTGTTFVGAMLGAAPRVGVVFEPFHPDAGVAGFSVGPPTAGPPPRRVEFPFVAAGHPAAEPFRALLAAAVTGRAVYKRPRGKGRLGWAAGPLRRLLTSRLALHNRWVTAWPRHRRFVVKDPHLCLAAAFVHCEMGWECLFITRHPAATAESWTRLGWNPDLDQFGRQDLLWERHLTGLPRPDVQRAPPLEKAAYAWLYIHKVVMDTARAQPGVAVVKLEDLAQSPLEWFPALYERFGLSWSRRAARAVLRHTACGGSALGSPNRPHCLRRDSRTVVAGWKERLSPRDQLTVRRIVGEVGAAWYPDPSW